MYASQQRIAMSWAGVKSMPLSVEHVNMYHLCADDGAARNARANQNGHLHQQAKAAS